MRKTLASLVPLSLVALLYLGAAGCSPKTSGVQGTAGNSQPPAAVTTQDLSSGPPSQAASVPPAGSSAQATAPSAARSPAQGKTPPAAATKPPAPAREQPATPSSAQPAAVPAPVTVTAKKVQQNSDTIQIDLSIPVVAGLADSSLQTRINARFEQDALQLQDEITKQAAEDVKEAAKAGYPFRQYNVTTAYSVAYNQNGLLSITVDYYQFTGGAHGGTERRPYNYDLTTGQELALKDLFNQGVDYKAIINQEIGAQIKANPDGGYFTQPDMGFKTIADDQPFSLAEGSLVVHFAQYEIAPYAAGMPEFKISFSLFNGGVRARFLAK